MQSLQSESQASPRHLHQKTHERPAQGVAQAWVTWGIAMSTSIVSLTKKQKTPQQPTFKIDTSKMGAKLKKMAHRTQTLSEDERQYKFLSGKDFKKRQKAA